MKTEMIRVYGIVQGVGFRPFVSREASELGLFGTVANKGSYVEIHAQGSEKAVEELKKALENRPPERSVIMEVLRSLPQSGFQEIPSQESTAACLMASTEQNHCSVARKIMGFLQRQQWG